MKHGAMGVRGRLTQHCTTKPTGTPTLSTSVHTEAEGSSPGWGLLAPPHTLTLPGIGPGQPKGKVCHVEGPRPCTNRLQGPTPHGGHHGIKPPSRLRGQSPAERQLGQMAPCPGLAETNKESERPGVEGKVAEGGFSRPDPRAFCLAGMLLSL